MIDEEFDLYCGLTLNKCNVTLINLIILIFNLIICHD